MPDEIENMEEDELLQENVPEISQPVNENPRTVWIGSSAAPRKAKDGLSDLLTYDSDEESRDVDDLVEVDFERDILDAGEDGTLDDLTRVTNADIMGTPRKKKVPKQRYARRYPPVEGMGGIR